MDRTIVLHVRVAAEGLPVRILHPPFDQRLVRLVERVLEVVQADHQPYRLGRGPHVLAVAVGKGRVESRPVDLASQLEQRVIEVEDLIEMGLEKLKNVAGLWLGFHGFRSHIARF